METKMNIQMQSWHRMAGPDAQELIYIVGTETVGLWTRYHFSFDYGMTWGPTLVDAYELANAAVAIRIDDIPTDHHIDYILAQRAEARTVEMHNNEMFESFMAWLHPEQAEEEAELDRWLAERGIVL